MGSHCRRSILVTAASCDLSGMSISPCRIFSRIRWMATAPMRRLATGWPELPTAPRRTSTLHSRRSRSTQPPTFPTRRFPYDPSSSSLFDAAAPSAAGSLASAIPDDPTSPNFRRGLSSESSPFDKTLASMDRLRAALPHVIHPRRVSTATDPPIALRMRPVTSS
ncbi:hypothetical protein T07_11705 [Trichinella nelsoni]|uniref:Uncharacterized protein n=1 Tax=Trichinella nelsoni TaxID=6336 RepID=A0A0V0S478_9BILA|nr:hypothetical protein T07_11705 [Trichinella nelsoni]